MAQQVLLLSKVVMDKKLFVNEKKKKYTSYIHVSRPSYSSEYKNPVNTKSSSGLGVESAAECTWQHRMVEAPWFPSWENPNAIVQTACMLYVCSFCILDLCGHLHHTAACTGTMLFVAHKHLYRQPKILGDWLCSLEDSQGLQLQLPLITFLVLHLPPGNTCTQLPYPWFGNFRTNT